MPGNYDFDLQDASGTIIPTMAPVKDRWTALAAANFDLEFDEELRADPVSQIDMKVRYSAAEVNVMLGGIRSLN